MGTTFHQQKELEQAIECFQTAIAALIPTMCSRSKLDLRQTLPKQEQRKRCRSKLGNLKKSCDRFPSILMTCFT
ncbi:MAG: hypothetical protein HC878_16735 [Leptolyngbyaceae cyanobacterium SL_5_14]|nr:hypothetical protein [Leptolyngbyaceae cyanobacterium SL_5_14]